MSCGCPPFISLYRRLTRYATGSSPGTNPCFNSAISSICNEQDFSVGPQDSQIFHTRPIPSGIDARVSWSWKIMPSFGNSRCCGSRNITKTLPATKSFPDHYPKVFKRVYRTHDGVCQYNSTQTALVSPIVSLSPTCSLLAQILFAHVGPSREEGVRRTPASSTAHP